MSVGVRPWTIAEATLLRFDNLDAYPKLTRLAIPPLKNYICFH